MQDFGVDTRQWLVNGWKTPEEVNGEKSVSETEPSI
jgi:hypothetical protein